MYIKIEYTYVNAAQLYCVKNYENIYTLKQKAAHHTFKWQKSAILSDTYKTGIQ